LSHIIDRKENDLSESNRSRTCINSLMGRLRANKAVLIYKPERSGGLGLDMFQYIVQPGDLLWSIAERFGVTVAAILYVNPGLTPYSIYPGQLIYIPVTGYQVYPRFPFYPSYPRYRQPWWYDRDGRGDRGTGFPGFPRTLR
jgi:hypothetical protein